MKDDINIIVVEDDPYSRNWMTLLAARDWRTRVVDEAENPKLLLKFLRKSNIKIDLIILDTDIPGDEDWLPTIIKASNNKKHFPKIICTGIRPNKTILKQLTHKPFAGYIIKREISNSITWAISLAMEGNWVITDSIQALISEINFPVPKPCVVLDGQHPIQNLTKHQAHVARLAFLFSMERRNLADELGITEDWGYGLVSAVYEKMGLKDVMSNEEEIRNYLGNHELLITHLENIKSEANKSNKTKEMETLAFHMLTMPEIRYLN